MDASFVGHPLADVPRPAIEREDYAAEHRLDPAKAWITVMPGSRVKEVRMNLPVILESAEKLGPTYEFLLPVAPTLDRAFLERLIGWLGHPPGSQRPSRRSTTRGEESSPAGPPRWRLRMMGTPFVMVYRVSPLTYRLGKPRVKVPHFAMVNLIAGQEVVPELVQRDFTSRKGGSAAPSNPSRRLGPRAHARRTGGREGPSPRS